MWGFTALKFCDILPASVDSWEEYDACHMKPKSWTMTSQYSSIHIIWVLEMEILCEIFTGFRPKPHFKILVFYGGACFARPIRSARRTFAKKIFQKFFQTMTSPLNSVLPSLKSIIFSFQLKWYIVFCTIFTMCSSSAMPILSGRWRCRNNEICLYRYVPADTGTYYGPYARTTPGNATTTAKTNFFKLKLLRRNIVVYCMSNPWNGCSTVWGD
jgi:hypothetical protein